MNPRPKLRTDLVLVEQSYRGEQSFILKDPETRKYYRFRPLEVRVMQALDGEHTLAEAVARLQAEGVRVSEAVVQKFADKLAGMGLCERTLGERSVLLMERLRAERRRRLGKGIFQGDLLRLRWSVGDPDKLLDRCIPYLGFFFSRTFLLLSVGLFALYFLVIALKWEEFSRTLVDLYTLKLGVSDYVVLWMTSMVIIVFHELGHGFTCKHFGGQVHEIGAMLIYFEPAFFCNVNDAWTFPERRARLWVTAAGSWIQFVIAALAAIVWWAAAPGTLVHDVAFAAVLIGGVITVLLNTNPLIPLDGYYALSDYLEVPNLRQRASGYLTWLIKTRILRLEAPRPPADERERRIFLIYGALAAAYITLILAFCAVNSYGWLDRHLGAVGVFVFVVGAVTVLRRQLAGWGTTMAAAVRRHGATLLSSPNRRRILIGVSALIILGLLIPWPITISGRFAVAPETTISLTAPDSGFVAQVNVHEGTRVVAGAQLLRLRNLTLEREAMALRRSADSLMAVAANARATQQFSEAARLEVEQEVQEARLAGINEQLRAFQVRALSPGIVLTPRPEELIGRWVSRGESLLHLGQPDTVEVRIYLAGAGASAVQIHQPVSLLPDASLGSTYTGRVTQVSIAAGSSRSLECRVRLAAADFWRPGMTGRARITLDHSNLWGALAWAARRAVRSDILL
jgi:putative peptide zinc metalloprotease protein